MQCSKHIQESCTVLNTKSLATRGHKWLHCYCLLIYNVHFYSHQYLLTLCNVYMYNCVHVQQAKKTKKLKKLVRVFCLCTCSIAENCHIFLLIAKFLIIIILVILEKKWWKHVKYSVILVSTGTKSVIITQEMLELTVENEVACIFTVQSVCIQFTLLYYYFVKLQCHRLDVLTILFSILTFAFIFLTLGAKLSNSVVKSRWLCYFQESRSRK